MVRLSIILVPLLLALWVYAMVTVILAREQDCRYLPKWGWMVVVLFFSVIGSLVWLVFGRYGAARPRAYERSAPAFPEYDRLGRQSATESDADDAFLKQVRERAEAQRRVERQARLQRQRDIEESSARRRKDPENPEPTTD